MKKLILRLLRYIKGGNPLDRALEPQEKKELFIKEYKEYKKYN